MNRLGAGEALGRIFQDIEGGEKGGVAEVWLARVPIDAIEEGGNIEKLESAVHEVEVLDFGFAERLAHGGMLALRGEDGRCF